MLSLREMLSTRSTLTLASIAALAQVHVLQVLSQRLNHIFESLLAHSELRTLKELLLRQQLFFIQRHENARFHVLLLSTSIACKPPQPYFSQAASRIH